MVGQSASLALHQNPQHGTGSLRILKSMASVAEIKAACGFKLANDGHDTRALQHYLGHKNIQHTVRYTEMAPDRFKDFWGGY